jgi:DNA repair exonuclease SbcCD ATPase subunit
MGILKKDAKKKPVKGKKEIPEEKTAESETQNGSQDPADASGSDGTLGKLVAEAVSKSNKFTHRMLIGCVIFIVFLISGYGFLAWQTSSRVSGLDDNIQATLDSIQVLNETIAKLSSNQGEFKDQQSLLGEAVVKAELSVTEMQEKLPAAAAEKVSLETDKVVLQIRDLKKSLKNQEQSIASVSSVVSNLGSQLQVFEDRLQSVQKLSDDVQALVVLEKEKYLSVLERQADLQEKQSGSDPIKVPRDPNMVFYSIQSSD